MRARLVVAAGLFAATLAAPASDATCVNNVCTPAGPGSVDTRNTGNLWDTCSYVKDHAPPPPGWTAADNGGPYLFFRTKQWGLDHPAGWNSRVCDLSAATDLLGVPTPVVPAEVRDFVDGLPINET